MKLKRYIVLSAEMQKKDQGSWRTFDKITEAVRHMNELSGADQVMEVTEEGLRKL